MTRLGSLCTGYGGLDLAAEAVLGPLEHVWHAELDPHASKVLAHHWPGVPNLGDLTAVDWAQVEPVDVLTAGFPCQDVSCAGQRAGLKPGTRTGVWSHIAHAIGILRPPLVLLENVEGLLSARAHSDVEPCPWCLGDIDPDLVVRALGAVLADLAGLGFDAEWTTVSAADVGAPHRRKRVFIVAWPADAPRPRLETWRQGRTGGSAPTDAASVGHGDAGPQGVGGVPAAAVTGGAGADRMTLLPTPRATDGTKGGPNQRGSSGDLMLPSADVQLLPTPTAAHHTRNATVDRDPADAGHSGWTLNDVAHTDRWGDYALAIARWEHVLGRPAPDPTEPGRNGQPRLAAAFVEWLMGLSAGWVVDLLDRNPALKCLGNGVVWQQAAHAYAELLGVAS